MTALNAVESLPENLKSYYQVPDDLFSTVCNRVLREQKILDFSSFLSFLIHFQWTWQKCRELCVLELMCSVPCVDLMHLSVFEAGWRYYAVR